MFHRTGHLTDQELICFVDGEAAQSSADRIRRHLAACADCRSRKESFEAVASQFVELHRAAVDPQIPSAAGPRATLKAQLAAARQPAPTSRLGRFLTAHPWVYLYAAVAVAALSITALDRQGRFFNARSLPPQLEARLLPDSGLTPGATRPVGLADICPQSDDDLDPAVSPSIKKTVFLEYGMPDAPAGDYQVDYLINPQLGGTDDVRNLWPEPYKSKVWNARAKDALEDRLHHMVCARQIDLASAQHDIATDWIAAYKKYFHTANPA